MYKIRPVHIVTCLLWTSFISSVTTYSKVLSLTKLWNGSEPPVKVNVSVSMENDSQFGAPKDVILDVRAPYISDGRPDNLPQTMDADLWNTSDVVGLVFTNPDNFMVQFDFNPEGRYYIQMFEGEKLLQPKDKKPELQFSPVISKGEWKALIKLPIELFPPRVNKVALYSWLGRPSNRTYYTLNTVPRIPSTDSAGPIPALRHPQAFQVLEFNLLLPMNTDGPPSNLWAEYLPTVGAETRNNTTGSRKNSSDPRAQIDPDNSAVINKLSAYVVIVIALCSALLAT